MIEGISIREAANLLGCSTRTLRNYIRKGFLTPSKVEDKRGFVYRFSKVEVEKFLNTLSSDGKGGKFQSWKIDSIPYKKLYEKVESEKKELDFQLKEALVRLGQLESQRLMLTERAESLQKLEEEYRKEVEELRDTLSRERAEKEILIKKLEKFTRKKWWEFWKKPISQLLSEPSQL